MYRRLKPFFDIFLAFILLVILLVPLVIIFLLVKITSEGPAFFVQERLGKDSKPFYLYKFRSMNIKAPQLTNADYDELEKYISPFGLFLRKTSIDELPQLWNILKGDMSFVGPRPLIKEDDKVILLRKKGGADKVLPGISGLAQVNGRNALTDEQKANFDIEYSKNISLRLDVVIVYKTIVSVIRGEGVIGK